MSFASAVLESTAYTRTAAPAPHVPSWPPFDALTRQTRVGAHSDNHGPSQGLGDYTCRTLPDYQHAGVLEGSLDLALPFSFPVLPVLSVSNICKAR